MRILRCAYDGVGSPPSDNHPLRLSIQAADRPPHALPRATGTALFLGVATGHATVRIGAESAIPLHPETSLIVRPDVPLVHQGPAPILALDIAPDAVTALPVQLPDGAIPAGPARTPHCRIDSPPALQHCLQILSILAQNPSSHQRALLDLTATQLLVLLLQSDARPFLEPSRPAGPPGLTDAVRYARRHLHRPLSIDELAKRACMSRSTFHRHFQTTFGVSPLQYVIRLRIQHARTLLHDPTRTVTDVSLDLGFGSVSHFIETFKRHTGTTPKAYQQSHQP
jgi:AraC-like DNA-binding protein